MPGKKAPRCAANEYSLRLVFDAKGKTKDEAMMELAKQAAKWALKPWDKNVTVRSEPVSEDTVKVLEMGFAMPHLDAVEMAECLGDEDVVLTPFQTADYQEGSLRSYKNVEEFFLGLADNNTSDVYLRYGSAAVTHKELGGKFVEWMMKLWPELAPTYCRKVWEAYRQGDSDLPIRGKRTMLFTDEGSVWDMGKRTLKTVLRDVDNVDNVFCVYIPGEGMFKPNKGWQPLVK